MKFAIVSLIIFTSSVSLVPAVEITSTAADWNNATAAQQRDFANRVTVRVQALKPAVTVEYMMNCMKNYASESAMSNQTMKDIATYCGVAFGK